MSESSQRPNVYSFKKEEAAVAEGLSGAVRAILKRPALPARDVHLCAILLKCLDRDMSDRYPYMSVVVRDLQAALYV